MAKKTQAPPPIYDAPEIMDLNQRQRKFVFEYAKCGVAYKAYMRAYGKDELSSMALSSKLLRDVKIVKALNIVKKNEGFELEQKYKIRREGLMAFLVEQLEASPDDHVRIKNGKATMRRARSLRGLKSFSYSESTSAEGSSSSFSFSMHDKLKAVEILARMIGAYDADPSSEDRGISSLRERAHKLVAKYGKG